MEQLRVGHIRYLNCVPFFQYLQAAGFAGELRSGVPSALNRMLQQGELDVSPSSSFEYARNSEDYLLLPNYAISSTGKVHSVLLFAPCELPALEGQPIAITGESATSINLLRILLREFYQHPQVSDYVPEQPIEELISAQKPALLIGDRALRMAEGLPAGMRVFDLGELWYQQTGLPFVFALWIIRRDALDTFRQQLIALREQLGQSLTRFFPKVESHAETHCTAVGLTSRQLVNYWQSIDYRLSGEHLRGLEMFFQLCREYDYLAHAPKIEFLQP